MKKAIICVMIILSLVVTTIGAFAELDFSNMTLEELMEAQEQIAAAIEQSQQNVQDEEGLSGESRDESTPELDTSDYIELAKGSKGDEVKALQTRLFDLGFYSIAIDGDYGNGTVNAVKDCEEYNNMEPTGVATPYFQAFIFSDNVKHKPVSVASIKVDGNLTALVGSSLNIAEMVIINPENATEKGVTYELDNNEYAEIDENGVLTAKTRGDVTVTITSMEKVDNPKRATVNVKVRQPSETLTLNDITIELGKGSTYQLEAVVGPENADDKSVVWTSDNMDIATVSSKGMVTAKGCGECDITCTTSDGSGVASSCHVVVIQLVTSIKLSDSKITLPGGKSYEIGANVAPEDATNKDVVWTSSDVSIANVSDNGKITAAKGGDCEITCSAADGSGKQATVKVHVPTFSVNDTEYTVASKNGLTIPVAINGNYSIEASSSSSCFDFDWKGNDLWIDPIKAGSGTIKLTNEDAKEDTITLRITIDHSAVYDSTSYPRATYEKILRDPYEYKGDKVSIYGKVLQKSESWGSVVLRVGTGGYGYYDKVFWVEYSTSSVSAKVIEDDYITVYGTCDGTHTYETVLGASITIPAIDAEKIIIGRK